MNVTSAVNIHALLGVEKRDLWLGFRLEVWYSLLVS